MAVVTIAEEENVETIHWAVKALLPHHDVEQGGGRTFRKSDHQVTISPTLSYRKNPGQRSDRDRPP